jgi:hypothetical protein
MIHKTFRLSAEVMHDYELYCLSDRAFRAWIYLRGADRYYGGCFPRDEELARYCRIRPSMFAKHVVELLAVGAVERGPDGHLALIPRRYERARVNAADWAEIRAEVFERDNYTCTYCGDRGGKLECDHIHPHSKGGADDLSNLTTACFACNRSKRDKTLAEWRGQDGAHQVN